MFLQDYEKIRLIGRGAFGSVYKVRHAELGYIRALKVCNDFIEDKKDKAWLSFLSECKVLLNIGNGSHPNIVRIYQPRLIDNRALVEMDCVEGESLHDYLQREPFVSYDEFIKFAEQIVGAVAYCHVDIYRFLMDPVEDGLTLDPDDGRKYIVSKEKEQELINKYGVVHNDLHSGNIIRRDYDGQYILLDFGLAIQNNKCVKSSSRHDGAIEYQSPEKLSHGAVQRQSDVYALGILLYEMLTGEVPFVYRSNDDLPPEAARNKVYMQHFNENPASIFEKRKQRFEEKYPGKEYKQDYPQWVERMILKCLSKHPEDRYENAKELHKELMSRIQDNADETKQKEEYEKKIAQLVSEQQKDKGRIAQLQKTLSSAPSHEEIGRLHMEAENCRNAMQETEKKLRSARETAAALFKERNHYKKALEELEKEQSDAPKNDEALEKELEFYKSTLEKFKTELREAEGKLNKLGGRLNFFKLDNETKARKIQELQRHMEGMMGNRGNGSFYAWLLTGVMFIVMVSVLVIAFVKKQYESRPLPKENSVPTMIESSPSSRPQSPSHVSTDSVVVEEE